MIRYRRIGVLVALALVCGVSASWAQPDRDDAVKREIERRFDVLPLRDGLALRPKVPIAGVRSVEISDGAIAVDGQPATGAELRSRLGAAADPVLRLSYLDDAARRALFGVAAPPSPDAAAPPSAAPTSPPPAVSDIAPPAPQAPDLDGNNARRRPRGDSRSGDRVRVGRSVNVDEGEVIEGDVVAVGGSVRVDGQVQGDVVAVGGGVSLGPLAVVDGDVTTVGGELRRDPGATVHGKAQEVRLGGFEFGDWTWGRNPIGIWWRSMLGSAFALVGTLARVAVLCLLAVLVVLFGRDYMDRAGAVATTSSLKAAGVGFLAQILFVPLLVITIVVLVVTIVGIPLLLLLPFALLALTAVALIGFTAVANRVGSFAASRFGWPERSPYAVTVTGVLILLLPVMLSRLASLGGGVMFPMAMVLGMAGVLIEYLAWTVGLGAVVLTCLRRGGGSQTGEPSPAA